MNEADRVSRSYAEFSTAEVESITGLTADLQRVWRRRRQISALQGTRAKVSLRETASIMVRYWLSQRGIAHALNSQLGEECGPIVIWYALMDCDGTCAILGDDKDTVDEFERQFETDERTVEDLVGIERAEVRRFLVGFDRAAPALAEDLTVAIDDAGSASGFYVDLAFLGRRLVQLADRPLVTVDLRKALPSDEKDGRSHKTVAPIRRLTSKREEPDQEENQATGD